MKLRELAAYDSKLDMEAGLSPPPYSTKVFSFL